MTEEMQTLSLGGRGRFELETRLWPMIGRMFMRVHAAGTLACETSKSHTIRAKSIGSEPRSRPSLETWRILTTMSHC